jgi:hypothetical protein
VQASGLRFLQAQQIVRKGAGGRSSAKVLETGLTMASQSGDVSVREGNAVSGLECCRVYESVKLVASRDQRSKYHVLYRSNGMEMGTSNQQVRPLVVSGSCQRSRLEVRPKPARLGLLGKEETGQRNAPAVKYIEVDSVSSSSLPEICKYKRRNPTITLLSAVPDTCNQNHLES